MSQNDNTNVSSLHTDRGRVVEQFSVSTIENAGVATYTPEQLLGGMILRDPNGAARSDVLPSVNDLTSEMGTMNTIGGSAFKFTIRNTADADETITITQDSGGWTLSGTMTIAQNNSKTFLVVLTNRNAATLYSLGTVVH